MRMLQLREIEVAALAGLLIWNEGAQFYACFACCKNRFLVAEITSIVCAQTLKEQIFGQLHASIVSAFGIGAAGARFGIILGFIDDIKVSDRVALVCVRIERANSILQRIVKEINDDPAIAKLLNPHFFVDYEEQL